MRRLSDVRALLKRQTNPTAVSSEPGSAMRERRQAMQLEGAVIGGEFSIVRSLGSGGMAQVFLARSLKTDASVAIKVLHAEQVGKARGVARFRREGRLLCKLRHPNLVRGYEIGDHDGRPYIVMEYVDGPSIGDLVGKRGRLKPDEALKLLLESALALNHLYLEGSVSAHRDIKPQNILVTRGGVAKLSDFGIAKAFDEDEGLTLTSTMMGSPHYMSPEQWTAPKHIDIRSDIYSLGCVFYEMLTGKKAYPGESQKAIMDAHFCTELPLVDAVTPLLGACNRVLEKCLTFEPTERYQTPHELATEVGTLVGADVAVVVPRHSRSNIRLVVAGVCISLAATCSILYVGNTYPDSEHTPPHRETPSASATRSAAESTAPPDPRNAPVEPPASVAPIEVHNGGGADVGAATRGSVDITGMSMRVTGGE